MDRGWRGRGYPRRGRGRGPRGQGYPGRGYGRGGQRRGGEDLLMDEDYGREHQGDRGFTPRRNVTWPIGYKRLEEMVEKDTSRDIVMKLAQGRSGLEERLRGDGGKAGSGMTQMLLKVFAKMSENYGPLNQSLIEILNLIIKYDFDRNIVDFIYENFTNDRRRQDVSHVTNALKVMNLLLTVIPKTSEKKVSILVIVLNSVVDGMGGAGEEAREYLQEVTETLEDLKEKQKVKKEKKQERGTSEEFDSQPAPNNFRDITVFPQLDEIKGTEKPFLRRNLIDKEYQNADHYLDVQFRLLREDFIRPLREGINEIMFYGDSDRTGQRFQNVKVYDNVKVEFMKPDQKGILHRIHFSTEKLQKVRWRNTKRLLYGNLLCLSSDTFKNDVLFAVVADRKAEDLEQGFLTVQFVHEEDEDAEDELEDEDELLLLDDEFGGAAIRREGRNARKDKIDMDKVYTMVETEAYFEAYRHVLAGLKETEDIPLERYIVSCVGDMQAPQYLRPSVAGRVTYDFSPIMENGRRVEVLHYDWPSSEELKLDHSQFEALKCALTNELAIIQGPPGTGKTYVGLQIMKILLKNKQRWASGTHTDGKQNCPILVVCYTNHALDQFLEGIAEFSSEEQTIVRVGGRCNNEVTKQFALNELRRKKRANKTRGDANAAMRKAIWETRNDLKEIEQKLQANCNKLEASLRCIQRFQELKEHIPRSLRDQFYGGMDEWSSSQDDVLLSWLGLRGGEEEPDFAQFAQELSSLTQAMLLSMGHSYEEMGRAFHATRIDDMMVLSDWITSQGQRPAGAAAMQGENNDNEDEDDYEGIKEEADLIQEDRLLDTDEAEFKTTERNVKENERHVHQLMKQMAALTFEDIGGHIADSEGGGWQQTRHSKRKAKQKIKKELGKTTIMTNDEERRVVDIYTLSMEQRWKLYRTWVNRWREQFRVMSGREIEKYNGLARKLEEYRREEDASIIHVADVVAITTTGAAKYRDLIYKMNCKIVVVEEAAEVLEAHIITAMPLSTKHLILIGDHQQLKPSPTVYQLAKQYNLDTSLFERLIGKIPHVTLSLQHRMRPEIADLIRPNIYRNLDDHDNVKGRPEITGVEKSVFFLSHTVLEESVADGRSKKNQYEADFLVALCKYLIMQGYKTEQITILAMYTGQLFAFRNTMREQISKGVRVTAVDNFQGEENDIILLSLVRSNTEGKVGFLSIDNRICVALSRAKHALYCVGNMDLLASRSPMWRKIVGHLDEKEAIGEAMMLQCKNHPDKLTPVKTAMDFSKVPEGGCGRPCETRLECGHVCPRPCHPDDHSKTKCQKKCDEILPCGHRCKKKCWQDCGICTERTDKVMPDCGHKQRVRCSQPLSEVLCMENLAVSLSCGHTCTLPCNQAKAPSRSLCTEKCQDLLECEHPCGGNCNNCYQGRLHVPCTKKCNRTLVCGHACTSNCSQCPPCEAGCKTKCLHSKCSKKCGEPCVMCRERCTWECPHYKCTNLCSEPCNRPPCNQSCRKRLKCNHPCIGLCGEPCPKLCRICDKKKVTEIFFGDEDEQDARFVLLEDCGHVFTYESLDHWMEQEEQDNAIKMKECPRCKTAIWRSTRYGKIINKLLNKVNQVKTTIYGDAARAGQDRRRLYTEILTEERKFRDTFMAEIIQIKDELKDTVTTGNLVLLEERFRRFQKLSELKEARRKLMIELPSDKYLKLVGHDLNCIHRWVLLPRGQTTQQDTESFLRETDRIKEALEYIDIEHKYQKLSTSSQYLVQFEMRELKNLLLTSVDPYDDGKKKKVEYHFKSIRKRVPELSSNLGISDKEREMICKAMGFATKGHWFSCPNGHIYAIGECGGATQTSRCPHCQEEIGGTGHRLLSTNRVATEMDGAGRSAFEADMERNHIPPHLLNF